MFESSGTAEPGGGSAAGEPVTPGAQAAAGTGVPATAVLDDGWVDPWDDPGFQAGVVEPPLRAGELTDPVAVAPVLLAAAKAAPAGELVERLAGIDPGGLDDAGRVELAGLWQRAENATAAAKLDAVAAFAGPAPSDPNAREAFAWASLAPMCGLGDGQATALVALARHLHSHLPATLAAMHAGDLSLDKARRIAERTYGLSLEDCARVEARVLGDPAARARAVRRSPAAFDAAVRRAVDRLDPDGADDRHREAKKDTRLHVEHRRDGMAELWARLTSVDAETIATAADAWARRAKAAGDPRPLDSLRVAALVDWANRFLTAPDAPTRHGRPVTINLVVDLLTYLGLRSQPGELLPSGALIPPAALRDLIPDAALRRLIIDPLTGHLLDAGRTTYRPPTATAAYVALRDVTATTPTGSQADAHTQDHDHIHPYTSGGPTNPDNLHSPTRRWHRARTHAGWTLTTNPDHTWTWTSPQGHTYRVEPHDYRLGP